MIPAFSSDDRQRLAETIRKAELATSGEIYCVLARRSDDYFYPAALILTVGMLAASLAATLAAHWWWIALDPVLLVIAQAAALAAVILVLWVMPGLRIHLVPLRLRYKRAHENAVRQFLAHNIHATESRTGVLIFVSLAERYAEVIGDSAINAKVEQASWNHIVGRLVHSAGEDRLLEGFVAAAAEVGDLLALHFPPKLSDKNELADHISEI